jgi:exodeoxyribonuclease VII large subunit
MFESAQGSAGLPRQVWGVAGLVHALADALASRFSACTVQGELSGWSRAASGHCYFSLKDADGGEAMLRCAMFRRSAAMLAFAPRDGQRVTVRGRVAVYEPRGELQFVVEAMQAAGAGALYEQFLRLKARLEAEGLFAPERKRALPAFPRRIGIVTSLGAAALHDVVTAFARRAPHVELLVYPSLVQGPDAPEALVQALHAAARRDEVDLLLMCRGGGSLEDLWAFNDERVVRAVAASPIPLVCGVGHETDVSLSDFAADLRAPTPTAAAELAAPATRDCLDHLERLAARLQRTVHQRIDTQAQRLDRAALRLARPSELLHREARRLDRLAGRLRDAGQRLTGAGRQRLPVLAQRLARAMETGQSQRAQGLPALAQRLARAMDTAQSRRAERLAGLEASLAALDPARVLRRGYAWLADGSGRPVTRVDGLAVGDRLNAVLADGRVGVQVNDITPDPPAA